MNQDSPSLFILHRSSFILPTLALFEPVVPVDRQAVPVLDPGLPGRPVDRQPPDRRGAAQPEQPPRVAARQVTPAGGQEAGAGYASDCQSDPRPDHVPAVPAGEFDPEPVDGWGDVPEDPGRLV